MGFKVINIKGILAKDINIDKIPEKVVDEIYDKMVWPIFGAIRSRIKVEIEESFLQIKRHDGPNYLFYYRK